MTLSVFRSILTILIKESFDTAFSTSHFSACKSHDTNNLKLTAVYSKSAIFLSSMIIFFPDWFPSHSPSAISNANPPFPWAPSWVMRKVACDLMGSKSSVRPRPCQQRLDAAGGSPEVREVLWRFFVGNFFVMIIVKGVTPKENDMICIVMVCLCVLLLL